MCRTYNKIGSLTTLKVHLERNSIHDFKSLKEVIDFQKSYTILRQQLVSHHENLIEQEKDILSKELPDLDAAIETQRLQTLQKQTGEIDKLKQQLNAAANHTAANFFQKLFRDVRHWNCNRKIRHKEDNLEFEVGMSIHHLVEDYQVKTNRWEFINSHFSEAARQSSLYPLSELEKKNDHRRAQQFYLWCTRGTKSS